MSDKHIMNFDVSDKSPLEIKHNNGEGKISRLSSLFESCQKEYDRLYKKYMASSAAIGISCATGLISGHILSGGSSASQLFANASDMVQTPAGKVLLGVGIGSYIVAGASIYANDKLFHKVQESKEVQAKIQGEIEAEKEFLLANENEQTGGYINGSINGEEFSGLDQTGNLESDVSELLETGEEMPKLVTLGANNNLSSLVVSGANNSLSSQELSTQYLFASQTEELEQ